MLLVIPMAAIVALPAMTALQPVRVEVKEKTTASLGPATAGVRTTWASAWVAEMPKVDAILASNAALLRVAGEFLVEERALIFSNSLEQLYCAVLLSGFPGFLCRWTSVGRKIVAEVRAVT
jgi:hypothetical protein